MIFYLAALLFFCFLSHIAIAIAIAAIANQFFVLSSVSVAQLNRDDDFMKIDGEWYKG